MVQVDGVVVAGRRLGVVGGPVEVRDLDPADGLGGGEQEQERVGSEDQVPGEQQRQHGAEAQHGADLLAAAVLGGVAELVVGLVLQLALDVEQHRLVEEVEEVGEDVVRVLLRVVRVAVVPLMDDLPRGVARDHDQARELADQPVDRPREVAVATIVDEHVEQDVDVDRRREQRHVPPAPRPDHRLGVARQQVDVQRHQPRQVAAVVQEVEPLVPSVLNGGLRGDAVNESGDERGQVVLGGPRRGPSGRTHNTGRRVASRFSPRSRERADPRPPLRAGGARCMVAADGASGGRAGGRAPRRPPAGGRAGSCAAG